MIKLNVIKIFFKGIIKKIKRVDMGYEFPEFKVEEIVKICKVVEEATTDGKRNLPPPTAEVFSKTENCIIQESDQCRQKHVKLCANSLTNNKDKIIGFEANLGTEYFSTSELTKDVEKTRTAAAGTLSRYWDEWIAEDREVSNFAKENKFKICYIETMPNMLDAQKLYLKFGFKYIYFPMGNTGHFACPIWMIKSL